ncbi:MAG: amidohydrolase, partial [Planctomycetes bacterium]|nr:amidohydrolase [Planctomycetota bacterium]
IFGLHVWPHLPTGTIGSRAGTFLAAAGELEITLRGKGGHAAMPHLCIDPGATAAKVITELQTIISRNLDPLDSGVISITTIHGGDAHNVIPETVKLTGTIRALTTERFVWLKDRVVAMTNQIAAANECSATIEIPGHPYPPTVNDAGLWTEVKNFAGELLGSGSVHEIPPVMGGEDFAFYTERIPGCFVGLGVRNESTGCTHHVHHPLFKVDEDALPIGSALHASFAFRHLT